MSVVSKRYARALLQIAKESDILEEIVYDLEIVAMELTRERKMGQLMKSAQINKEEKKEIIQRIFGKEINTHLNHFLMVLIDKNRFSELKSIYVDFKEGYLKEKNILEASIFSAIKLTNEHLHKLQEKLEKRTGKKVVVKNDIDESIIGGLIIYIGGQVIDGSIRNQLQQLRNKLQETGLEEVGV